VLIGAVTRKICGTLTAAPGSTGIVARANKSFVCPSLP
jgi:hypothetical protein